MNKESDATSKAKLFVGSGPIRRLLNEHLSCEINNLLIQPRSCDDLMPLTDKSRMSRDSMYRMVKVAVKKIWEKENKKYDRNSKVVGASVSQWDYIEIEDFLMDGPDEDRQYAVNWEALAKEMGLLQTQDTGQTQAWVDQAFADNEKAVKDAISNPKKAKAAPGFLRGQVMRISKGQADPKLVGQLIDEKLNQLSQ